MSYADDWPEQVVRDTTALLDLPWCGASTWTADAFGVWGDA
jgi:hypothetical protein